MQFKILASSYGKHSDAKLALAVAEHIVQIGADASGQDVADCRKLQSTIADVMETAFRQLAEFEHAGIGANGTAHLASSLAAHPEILANTVGVICDAIATSPFASAETGAMVRKVVGQYLEIAQHMHRDWFARHGKVGHGRALSDAANHNPDCPHVARWKAIHDAGDPIAIHEHAMGV